MTNTRIARRGAATLFLALLGVGCHDSVTGPRVTPTPLAPTPTPTPTPGPTPLPGSIVGYWTGTANSNVSPGCGEGAATASFQQSGTSITGLLDAPYFACGFTNLSFQGTLVGSDLSGTGTGIDGTGLVSGTLSGNSLVIQIFGLDVDTTEVDLNLHH